MSVQKRRQRTAAEAALERQYAERSRESGQSYQRSCGGRAFPPNHAAAAGAASRSPLPELKDPPVEDFPELEDIPEKDPAELEPEGAVGPEPELMALEGEAEDVKLVAPLEKKYLDYYDTPKKFVTEVVKALNRVDKDPSYRVKKDGSPLHYKPPGELVALLQKYSPERWRGSGGRRPPSPPPKKRYRDHSPLAPAKKPQTGSGFQVDDLFNRLYVSLGSIRAGNTSTKLRQGVVLLLAELVKRGAINEFQRRKILKDYIR